MEHHGALLPIESCSFAIHTVPSGSNKTANSVNKCSCCGGPEHRNETDSGREQRLRVPMTETTAITGGGRPSDGKLVSFLSFAHVRNRLHKNTKKSRV